MRSVSGSLAVGGVLADATFLPTGTDHQYKEVKESLKNVRKLVTPKPLLLNEKKEM